MEFFVIIIWILFLISFLSGYLLGQGRITREGVIGAIQQAKKKLDNSPVGAIKTPTARDIYLRDHPLEKAEQEEMRKELDKLKL